MAALLVLVYHCSQFDPGRATRPLAHSYLAVDLFFILSGFVIGLVYDDRLSTGMGKTKFLEHRLVRLWPVIALGAVLGAFAQLVSPAPETTVWPHLFTALLMIPTVWLPPRLFGINSPQWSLFFELVANIAYGLLASIITTRRLIAFVVAAAVVLLATAQHYGNLSGGWSTADYPVGFARVVFGFSAGLLLHRLWRFGHLRAVRIPYVFILAALPVAVTFMGATKIGGHWWADPLCALAFPAIIWTGIYTNPAGQVRRISSWAGAVSYPLYATQGAVRAAVLPYLKGYVGDKVLRDAILVATSIAVAWIVLRFFANPLQRALRGWVDRRTVR